MLTDHILAKRGPKRWPPQFFTGQAGCACCPPPPPPPPTAYYGYRYGYGPYEEDLRACCYYPTTGVTGLPLSLTVTVTGGTCTCLQGKSWKVYRAPNSDGGDTKVCIYGTRGTTCRAATPAPLCPNNIPFSMPSARFGSYDCNGTSRPIGFLVRINTVDGLTHSTGHLCYHICQSSIFGNDAIGDTNVGLQVVSCNPLVWESNTETVNMFGIDLCGLGAGVGGTVIFTVTL